MKLYLSVVFLFISCIFGQCIWNYNNPNADWPALACTQTCAGSQQSPVDVASIVPNLGPLNLTGYEDGDFILKNTGYTVEVEIEAGYVGFYKPGYNIAQYHFHTLAEHELYDHDFPLTMHIVHKNLDLSPVGITVLTILWNVTSTDHPWLAPIIAALPLITNASASTPLHLEGLNDLFEDMSATGQDGYVNFAGSLTTPPCTEGVDWYVFMTPLSMSFDQWFALRQVMGNNQRPIQRVLYNVSAYVPPPVSAGQAPVPSPVISTPPPVITPPPPAPVPGLPPNAFAFMDKTYYDGFWVVFTLLILVAIALATSLVVLRNTKKANKPPVVIDS